MQIQTHQKKQVQQKEKTLKQYLNPKNVASTTFLSEKEKPGTACIKLL